MQASQLRLDQYHVDELRFSLDDDYRFEGMEREPELSAEDLDVEVEPFRNPEEPLQWYFRLSVRLNDKNGKYPYMFSIRLSGFFEVSKDCGPDMVEPLALINAPSILYAAAREILAIVTARSRYLSIFLPSLRFFGPPAKTIEVPKQKETTSGLEKGTKPSKAARRVVGRKK
jgi:preprotein translocase subunit SecB